MNLYGLLKTKVKEWRGSDYQSDFSVIREIFDFAFVGRQNNEKRLRYLRPPQFEALETYRYLRLKEDTPHIFDLSSWKLEEIGVILKILIAKIVI